MTTWPETEKQLAEPMAAFLMQRDWIPHPEVQLVDQGPVADWVAVLDNRLASVFEVKKTLSAKLLRQAEWWMDHADYVSIVLPAAKPGKHAEEREKFYPLLERIGLGTIELSCNENNQIDINVVLKARRQLPGRSGPLIGQLHDGHRQVGKAGSATGERWTPYKQTLHRLRQIAKDEPGIYLSDAVKAVEHHWATDAQATAKLHTILVKDGLTGFRCEDDHGKTRLYVDEGDERGTAA
jgi:hypothetical protein